MDENLHKQARDALASASADSDAAAIISRALAAHKARGDKRDKMLADVLDRAKQANEFAPPRSADIPPGWPGPSLPGLLRAPRQGAANHSERYANAPAVPTRRRG